MRDPAPVHRVWTMAVHHVVLLFVWMLPMRSDTNDRRTPRWFFDACASRYGSLQLDAAATIENRQTELYLGPGSPYGEDALTADWSRALIAPGAGVWCNPPYGPSGTIPRWIAKARHERDRHRMRTLMLLPADTSTAWYRDVSHTELVELVPFRLAFDAPDRSTKGNVAKFGSVLVWIAPRIAQPTTSRRTRTHG